MLARNLLLALADALERAEADREAHRTGGAAAPTTNEWGIMPLNPTSYDPRDDLPCEWSDYDEIGICDTCREERPVRLLPDPYIVAVEEDYDERDEWWCQPCHDKRRAADKWAVQPLNNCAEEI
jgi:hypothetical protein